MVKITNKQTFFKAVNMVASKMEGHRSARMTLAYAIVSECRLTEVNTLFTREDMTSLVKLVVSAGITPETVEQAKEEKAKQSKAPKPKKERSHRRTSTTKAPAQAEKIMLPIQLDSINEHFTTEQAQTVYAHITRYAEHANQMNGTHLDAARFNFLDGVEALSKVETLEDLQPVMVAFFFRESAKRMIRKFLEFGIGYKNLSKVKEGAVKIATNEGQKEVSVHEQKNGYMQASSNRGNILTFEVDELLNDLIIDSYRLTFDEGMFNSVGNAYGALFFRLSNIIQVRTRELRNQTKVKTSLKKMSITDMIGEYTNEDALRLAEDMGIFTDAEMDIIKMRIAGFKKQEIDKIVGKRTDRVFNHMKKSYSQAI
ncbi:hypothetical protein AAXB25_14765 [Paenibacillus lautus]|uniref:hypothetical protein n=1 Tax=Paenibacillus lautus TaxID=1401 RepID=UPI003D2AE3E0